MRRLMIRDLTKLVKNIAAGMTWQKALLKTKFFKTYAYVKFKGYEDVFKQMMMEFECRIHELGAEYVIQHIDEYLSLELPTASDEIANGSAADECEMEVSENECN